VQINPDIPEAHTLRGWYDQGGNQVDIQDISNQSGGGSAGGSSTQTNWKSLEQIREEQLGMHDKADYFTSTATITFAKKENSMYQACSSDNCNKKVVDQNNGMFRCEKCNKDSDTYRWRMILSVGFCIVLFPRFNSIRPIGSITFFFLPIFQDQYCRSFGISVGNLFPGNCRENTGNTSPRTRRLEKSSK
jgi:hypothetical protein